MLIFAEKDSIGNTRERESKIGEESEIGLYLEWKRVYDEVYGLIKLRVGDQYERGTRLEIERMR